jgi:hypothetical protein
MCILSIKIQYIKNKNKIKYHIKIEAKTFFKFS